MREISSGTNEYIKELRSLKQKKFRDSLGKYLVEGSRIIEEALDFGAPIEAVLVSDERNSMVGMAEDAGVETILVPYHIIEQIGDTKTPPKEIACIQKTEQTKHMRGSYYVALDDINDPKNVGAIIRTADAMGADGVWISDNSADLYGPKVQRAAMGSTFHLNIETLDLQARLQEFQAEDGVVLASSLSGKDKLSPMYQRVCVVIGNEARGVSKDIIQLANEEFTVQLYGAAESLNASVAAGIFLYEVRQRLKG